MECIETDTKERLDTSSESNDVLIDLMEILHIKMREYKDLRETFEIWADNEEQAISMADVGKASLRLLIEIESLLNISLFALQAVNTIQRELPKTKEMQEAIDGLTANIRNIVQEEKKKAVEARKTDEELRRISEEYRA